MGKSHNCTIVILQDLSQLYFLLIFLLYSLLFSLYLQCLLFYLICFILPLFFHSLCLLCTSYQSKFPQAMPLCTLFCSSNVIVIQNYQTVICSLPLYAFYFSQIYVSINVHSNSRQLLTSNSIDVRKGIISPVIQYTHSRDLVYTVLRSKDQRHTPH